MQLTALSLSNGNWAYLRITFAWRFGTMIWYHCGIKLVEGVVTTFLIPELHSISRVLNLLPLSGKILP